MKTKNSARKAIVRALIFGALSAGLYAAVFINQAAVAAFGAQRGALAGLGEDRVRCGVARAGAVTADGLDAGGDEAVPLPRLDRVGCHADRLEARRAVAVDGHTRHVVESGEAGHDTAADNAAA